MQGLACQTISITDYRYRYHVVIMEVLPGICGFFNITQKSLFFSACTHAINLNKVGSACHNIMPDSKNNPHMHFV